MKELQGRRHVRLVGGRRRLGGAWLVALWLGSVSGCGDDHVTGQETGEETGQEIGEETGDEPEPVEQLWLLTIDEDEDTRDSLVQISVEPGHEGELTSLCDDLALPDNFANPSFTALAYHDGELYASASRFGHDDVLVRVDPCGCEVTIVGGYGFDEVEGIASTSERLFGLSSESGGIVEIDPQTGAGQALGSAGEEWGSHGLTWSDVDDELYAINAADDRLYRFRATDGSLIDSVALDADFLRVGVEWHPDRAELFACGLQEHPSALATVDLDSGAVTVIVEDPFLTACDNLARPSGPISCE